MLGTTDKCYPPAIAAARPCSLGWRSGGIESRTRLTHPPSGKTCRKEEEKEERRHCTCNYTTVQSRNGTNCKKSKVKVDDSSTGLGRDRDVMSHPTELSSQIRCSWDPTNITGNDSKDLDVAEVHPGSGSPTRTDTPPGH
ncbi:hypothetical protein BTVI_93804 [Pitangus sulphuratus]|nr:hypothetical protein BTVI_93804 [Pitangus sulphuratus]